MELQEFYKSVNEIINIFGKNKRIFQNERQLQFDLAWQIKAKLGLDVLFEIPFKNEENEEKVKKYVDLIVLNGESEYFAIELKYKTDLADVCGVELLRQGAGNLGCYDFWKDVSRLEGLFDTPYKKGILKDKTCVGGLALIITNDAWYWDNKRKRSNSQYYDFRLIKREDISNVDLKWKIDDEEKWKKFMESEPYRNKKIHLFGQYIVDWKIYYSCDNNENLFKFLLFKIDPKDVKKAQQ